MTNISFVLLWKQQPAHHSPVLVLHSGKKSRWSGGRCKLYPELNLLPHTLQKLERPDQGQRLFFHHRGIRLLWLELEKWKEANRTVSSLLILQQHDSPWTNSTRIYLYFESLLKVRSCKCSWATQALHCDESRVTMGWRDQTNWYFSVTGQSVEPPL